MGKTWNTGGLGGCDLPLAQFPFRSGRPAAEGNRFSGDGYYAFYSIASDYAGNTEVAPESPDVTVTVTAGGGAPAGAGQRWEMYE